MAIRITTRESYTLRLKFCNQRNMPQLYALARPLVSRQCYFDIVDRAQNNYPQIRANTDVLYIPRWSGPYVIASEASIQKISTNDYFILGAGGPLCQQSVAGGTVSLVPYSQLPVSTNEVGNDTLVSVTFNFGPAFEKRVEYISSLYGLPADAITGNTPSIYEARLFSGPYSAMRVYWSDTVTVNIYDGPSGPPRLCDVSFGPSSTSPTGQTQTGMGVTGGAA